MFSKIGVIRKSIRSFFADNFEKIAQINNKYKKPRIQMSRAVKFSLLLLRLYLIFLVLLLAYKFSTLIR